MPNRLKVSIVLFLISFSLPLFADDSLQSLRNENTCAMESHDTTAIIRSYLYLGSYLQDLGEYNQSDSCLLIGLKIAEDIHFQKGAGSLCNLLGSNASYVGNRPLALNYYHRALKHYTELNDLNKVAMIMMNIGSEYEDLGNYRLAIAYELKALKNKESSGNTKNLAYYYQHVGQLFKTTDLKKWKFYVDKAYKLSQQPHLSNLTTRVAIFNDLGGIAEKEGNYTQAYAWYDSTYLYAKAGNYLNGMSTALSNRSILLQTEGKYDEALEHVLRAITIVKKSGRTYPLITDKIHAASILVNLGRITEAHRYATEALTLAQQLTYYKEQEADAHRLLAIIDEKSNNWESAYWNYKTYKQITDSIQSNDIQKAVQELETKYQSAEKEISIQKLKHENDLKNSRLHRTRQLVIGLIIIFLLSGIVIVLLNRHKRLTHEKLQANLQQQLLRSQMNPHFIFNVMGSIQSYLYHNESVKAADYLSRFASLSRSVLEFSSREKIKLSEEIEMLQNYIELEKARLENSFGINFHIENSLETELIEIPPMLLQPFVENAIKHGLKDLDYLGKLDITFEEKGDFILVKIEDNGRGLVDNKNKTHTPKAIEIFEQRKKGLEYKYKKTLKFEIQNLQTINQTQQGVLVRIQIPILNHD